MITAADDAAPTDHRTRVLLAAVDAFAERGADGVRLKDISDRVGMSPGHILYYFGRKDRVLLETLAWSETELVDRRRRELGRLRSSRRALRRFIELYLPVAADDPRWNLWAQVSARPPTEEQDRAQVAGLEAGWTLDLAQLVRRGVDDGTFREDVDAEAFAERWVLTMNGVAEQVRLGVPGHDVRWAVRYVEGGMTSDLGKADRAQRG